MGKDELEFPRTYNCCLRFEIISRRNRCYLFNLKKKKIGVTRQNFAEALKKPWWPNDSLFSLFVAFLMSPNQFSQYKKEHWRSFSKKISTSRKKKFASKTLKIGSKSRKHWCYNKKNITSFCTKPIALDWISFMWGGEVWILGHSI